MKEMINSRIFACPCGETTVQGIVIFKYRSGANKRFIERFNVLEETKGIDPSSGQEGISSTLEPHRCQHWTDLQQFFPEVVTVEAIPQDKGGALNEH